MHSKVMTAFAGIAAGLLLAAAPAAAAGAADAGAVAAGVSDAGAADADTSETGTEFGGGVYIFTHQPVGLAGAEGKTEIYALYGDVSHREGPWEFHLQARWRDTKLRAFYPSTTWVQEGWAAVTVPVGPAAGGGDRGAFTLRAGKVYQRIGRFWDGSFFGNVQYFDGLKLDPEFGVEGVLRWPVGEGRLEAYGQYLADGDRINGALAGRDLEGVEGGSEGGGFAGGLRYRTPEFAAGDWPLRASAGVSGLWERGEFAVPEGAAGPATAEADLNHLALDVELSAPHGRAYLEWTRREVSESLHRLRRGALLSGRAAADADYWLAGVQVDLGIVHLRYNLSRAEYGPTAETIHQPGVTVDLTDRIHVLLEYDDWTRDRNEGADGRIDRSLNGVLWVQF